MAVYRGLVFIAVFFTGTLTAITCFVSAESEHTSNLTNNLTTPQETTEGAAMIKDVFDSMQLMGLEVLQNKTEVSVSARMKMSDFMLNPLMLVPQLIMWGFAPILLANLKMFVMQALMLNKMALSSAIFMTLRNIVFGPRPGAIVKYSSHGHAPGHNQVYHYHKH